MDRHLEILDLNDAQRELVSECALLGTRTVFEKSGNPVAMLISHDEYLAMRETLEIGSDAVLREAISRGDDEAKAGKVMLVEDLLEMTL